jgi:menaquinol-cytochrome c reductase iron-sulfur subunit
VSKKEDVTRRQFLNYTLTGVGGFMGAAMILPMVRFAIDPILKQGAEKDMVQVMKVEDITNEPQLQKFNVDQVDGWYESEVEQSIFVYKDTDDNIITLSPICKHLGCTVDYGTDPAHPDQFFCPCHAGRYTKDGVNVKGTPPLAPLDTFVQEVKDGYLYVGKTKPQEGA